MKETLETESDIQRRFVEEMFPSSREALNALFNGAGAAADLTDEDVTTKREDAIARSVVYINGAPLTERLYSILNKGRAVSSFREILFQCKPYLASNNAWRAWWAMKPADRWYAITGIEENK